MMQRIFRSDDVLKYLEFNKIAKVLYIALALLLGACSTGPSHSTFSDADSNADLLDAGSPVRGGSRGGLSRILQAAENTQVVDQGGVYTSDAQTVWPRIRAGYQLQRGIQHPDIDKELAWYRANPAFLYHATERSNRYLHYVLSAVQQRNMPTELVLLPIVESAYDPFAYSKSGAAGLWQFMPDTGSNFGLRQNWWYDGRKDVVAATDAALNYLQFLHDKFDGDWLLAIAAYNFGEGSIQRAVDSNRKAGLPTDFWHLSLREETRTYIPRLLALAKVVDAPHSYGINLYAVPNEAYFAAVDTNGQLDLAKAASLANVDVDEIYRLNPGLSHTATDPSGQQRLLLPVAAVDRFTAGLSALPSDERTAWSRYEVKPGDTLVSLARRFNTDTASLNSANRLHGAALKPGQTLMVAKDGHVEDRAAPSPHTTASAAPAGKPAAVASSAPQNSTQIFHTVVAGDNLLRISQHYGVQMADIRRWNGIAPDGPIKLGQHLAIWTDKGPAVSSAQPAQAPHKVGYKVQSGDSLVGIASKFNVQIADIVRWNGVDPRALLQPGQQLTLFLEAVAGR